LSEGRVEKLSITEELDRAINEVFPSGADYGIEVRKDFASEFAPLLMQRSHLSGILVNLLQNAREALHDRGHVHVSARALPDYSIEVVIADNGPGVPGDKLGRIFEPYFTTKEKGTGLGLAIVKHNLELYGGTIRLESKLGKGARFVLLFPAKRIIKLAK
jgi:signal transduction histidine kinase